MNIYTIISKEATEKYAGTYLAYNYKKLTHVLKKMLEMDIKFYASISMDQQLKTGLWVVSEDRAIEVLGLNNYDGKQVLAMMYELKLTERQNGMAVI